MVGIGIVVMVGHEEGVVVVIAMGVGTTTGATTNINNTSFDDLRMLSMACRGLHKVTSRSCVFNLDRRTTASDQPRTM